MPAIPKALAWADDYKNQHGQLIDLSQAVPDYPPHQSLLNALSSYASETGSCTYGEIEGETSLRKTYARLQSKRYQHRFDADQIHITAGCNQAFVASLIALAAPGDTVVMTNPGYFNHDSTIRMLGLSASYLNCESANQFVPSIRDLTELIRPEVKVVALVSPNNPTGAIYPPTILEQILELCVENGVWLVLDETYRDFLSASERPGHNLWHHPGYKNLVQLYSFSKSYCIPGHRLGAITATPEVVQQVAKVMDNMQICPNRASQLALADELVALDQWVEHNALKINGRAKKFREVLSQFPEWEIQSIGAYFAYVKHPFVKKDSEEVVQLLAQQYGLLPLPGSFFGAGQERCLRFAFANVDETTLSLLGHRLTKVRTQVNTPSEDFSRV